MIKHLKKINKTCKGILIFFNSYALNIQLYFFNTFRAVFKFEENRLRVAASGKGFPKFKDFFNNDERGFRLHQDQGSLMILISKYIIVNSLYFSRLVDEMSKRSKFVFVTWVGPSVSIMKKAKMSTDKALMKDIIQVITKLTSKND